MYSGSKMVNFMWKKKAYILFGQVKREIIMFAWMEESLYSNILHSSRNLCQNAVAKNGNLIKVFLCLSDYKRKHTTLHLYPKYVRMSLCLIHASLMHPILVQMLGIMHIITWANAATQFDP